MDYCIKHRLQELHTRKMYSKTYKKSHRSSANLFTVAIPVNKDCKSLFLLKKAHLTKSQSLQFNLTNNPHKNSVRY